MQKSLLFTTAFLIIAISQFSFSKELLMKSSNSTIYCITDNVNMRDKPGIHGKVLTTVNYGCSFHEIERSAPASLLIGKIMYNEPWIRVENDRYSGWVYGVFLRNSLKTIPQADSKLYFYKPFHMSIVPIGWSDDNKFAWFQRSGGAFDQEFFELLVFDFTTKKTYKEFIADYFQIEKYIDLEPKIASLGWFQRYIDNVWKANGRIIYSVLEKYNIESGKSVNLLPPKFENEGIITKYALEIVKPADGGKYHLGYRLYRICGSMKTLVAKKFPRVGEIADVVDYEIIGCIKNQGSDKILICVQANCLVESTSTVIELVPDEITN